MDDKTKLAVAMFARDFKQVDEFFLLPWKDVSGDEKPEGDCENFAWSVAKVVAGSLKKALLRMVTFQSVMWRGWSKKGGWIPRHAALWVRGEGWIDSNDRKWRKNGPGENYTRLYPVGTPFVLFGLYCLYKANQWGLI